MMPSHEDQDKGKPSVDALPLLDLNYHLGCAGLGLPSVGLANPGSETLENLTIRLKAPLSND